MHHLTSFTESTVSAFASSYYSTYSTTSSRPCGNPSPGLAAGNAGQSAKCFSDRAYPIFRSQIPNEVARWRRPADEPRYRMIYIFINV
jgi:hypothetical protein